MDRKSAVLAAQHLEVLIHILQCSGIIINTEKSVMSQTQEQEYLSILVNTEAQTNSVD